MDVRSVVNRLICHMKKNERAKAERKAEAKGKARAEAQARAKAEAKAEAQVKARARAEAEAKAKAKQKLTLQNGVCNSDSAAQACHDQKRQATASALNGKPDCLIHIHCPSHVLK